MNDTHGQPNELMRLTHHLDETDADVERARRLIGEIDADLKRSFEHNEHVAHFAASLSEQIATVERRNAEIRRLRDSLVNTWALIGCLSIAVVFLLLFAAVA